jgi:hypothetical protein
VVKRSFNFKKAYYYTFVHSKLLLDFVSNVKGKASSLKPRINWRKYYAKPKKDYTSCLFLGTGHALILDILALSIDKPSVLIVCPKNVVL